MDELEQIQRCFRAFIEGSLIAHDIDGVLTLFTDDIMGIGMGAQGVVRCREDMRPILLNTRSDVDDSRTKVQYSNMQILYYGDDSANICATITIATETGGKLQKSHIGQCASLRRIGGVWKINMVQATPLSVDIQEIEAYPLSFAEDEIEKYRMQEQFSNLMQQNMIATYKIDFELGKYEEYIPTEKYSVPVNKGDYYESEIFRAANVMLDGETRLHFIETFSIANLIHCYQSGHAEGDYVIQQTANMLRECFRREDIIGRLGGDEFCVFYTGRNQDEVLAKKTDQVCAAVRKIHPAKDGAPGTSISIGIVKRVGDESFDELYRKADRTLYARKARQGRNGFTIYESFFSDDKNEPHNS